MGLNKIVVLVLLVLLVTDYLYNGADNQASGTEMKHKRQYREISDEVKNKISIASKNKPKSETHKQHLSQSLTKYWQSVPHRPLSGNTPSVNNGGIV